jgi:Tfp pilus assembly protein PilO
VRDRVILISLAIVGVLAVFYLMVLSPKREKASELGTEIAQLNSDIDQQEQIASFADQARQEFPRYYGRLVVLGKAVPNQGDQASMIVQLNQVASRTGVDFRAITLSEGGGAASTASTSTATTPPTGTSTAPGTTTTPSDGTTTTSTDGSTPPSGGSTTATPSTSTGSAATPTAATTGSAAATEEAAASLPLGATVGPAGLPIMPYDLSYQGTFFDVADFMSGVDSLVHLREGSGQVSADGRLVTLDGFSLTPIPTLGGEQKLDATFAVTTYVVPADQGLTAGASPTGPSASALQSQATPASTTTPTVTP